MAMRIISVTLLYEGGVRKFTPLPHGAGPLDSPDKPRPLIQRPAGHPKHGVGVKHKSHGRRRNLRECGRRACRRIVAIDAIVRIDGDEYCALSIDREVLQERGRLPSRYRSSFDRIKRSPVMIRIIVFSPRDHLNPSHLCCGQALAPPSTVRFAPLMYDDSGPATHLTEEEIVALSLIGRALRMLSQELRQR